MENRIAEQEAGGAEVNETRNITKAFQIDNADSEKRRREDWEKVALYLHFEYLHVGKQ